MSKLKIISLGLSLLFLVQCQSPGLKVNSVSELPEQLQEGWNTQRWYFVNVKLDTPLARLKEKNINGLATSAIFRITDRLIFTTFNGFLVSADTLLKDVDRKRFSRGISAAPCFLRPIVFVPCEKGAYGLQAYDLLQQNVIWRIKDKLSKSSPLIQSDLLVHASLKGEVVALNPVTGQQIWLYQFPQKISQNLAMTHDRVVVCSIDGLLGALDADSGQPEFLTELPHHVYTSPMILNQAIFIADLNGNVLKVDLQTGKIIQQKSFNTPFYQPFSTDGQTLFIMGSNGQLFALSSNFDVLQSRELKGVPSMPIIVTEQHLIIGTYQKKLYLIDKTNFNIVQQMTLKRRPVSCTPDQNSGIFLATEYDRLQLFKIKEKQNQ